MTTSTVHAVAFVFTRPQAVLLIGDRWKDQKDQRYRKHVYPRRGNKPLDLSDKDPNVVVVLRPELVRDLLPSADRIHRVILCADQEEVLPFKVPLLDAVLQDGKYMARPRTGVAYYNERIEKDAVAIELSPNKKSLRKKPIKNITLSLSLDVLESQITASSSNCDIWKDLEEPLYQYITGDLDKEHFQKFCKNLVKLGANKHRCRAYFRLITTSYGKRLKKGFKAAVLAIEEDGGAKDLEEIAQSCRVKLKDLKVLLSMYLSEKEGL